MLVNSLHVLLLKCNHLLLLALVLDLLRPLPLDLQHLALLRVVHCSVMEVQQFLSLRHHDLKEGDRADFEVSFHFVDLHEWENQTFCTGHTLHS